MDQWTEGANNQEMISISPRSALQNGITATGSGEASHPKTSSVRGSRGSWILQPKLPQSCLRNALAWACCRAETPRPELPSTPNPRDRQTWRCSEQAGSSTPTSANFAWLQSRERAVYVAPSVQFEPLSCKMTHRTFPTILTVDWKCQKSKKLQSFSEPNSCQITHTHVHRRYLGDLTRSTSILTRPHMRTYIRTFTLWCDAIILASFRPA